MNGLLGGLGLPGLLQLIAQTQGQNGQPYPFALMPGGPFDQGKTMPGGQRIPLNFDQMIKQMQLPNDRNTISPDQNMSYLLGAPAWMRGQGI